MMMISILLETINTKAQTIKVLEGHDPLEIKKKITSVVPDIKGVMKKERVEGRGLNRRSHLLLLCQLALRKEMIRKKANLPKNLSHHLRGLIVHHLMTLMTIERSTKEGMSMK